jgi:hypothetical protein
MCVVRKYVVKRPEIEERERERLLLLFFGFFEQQQNGSSAVQTEKENVNLSAHKEEEGKTSIS